MTAFGDRKWRAERPGMGYLCPGGMLAGTTGGYRDYVAHRGPKIKR
jgi:hypothetical protein